jgi:hypothetical protein
MPETETLGVQPDPLLDGDGIPNDNQTHLCMSCEKAFTGIYCKHCGQKNDNYRRSLFSLLVELGATLTALEGRIWRTWGALLFKPGKVAREFADGARTKWSSPIRTYLAMSLILFGFMSLTQTHIFSFDVDVQRKPGITKPKSELTADDLTFDFQFNMLERQKDIDARNNSRDFELIKKKLFKEDGSLRLDLEIKDDGGIKINNAQDGSADHQNNVGNVSAEEIETNVTAAISESNDLYVDRDKEGQILINGKALQKGQASEFLLNFIQNPAIVTNSFRVWLPRLIFFLMPLTMLIGAVFIRGRENAMLYDHIIHAAYIHSTAFFLLFIGMMLSYIFPGGTIATIVFWLLMIYLPLSLRRMFKRGWIKTIWTSYGVGVIYTLFLFAGMVVILINTLSKNTLGAA